jgi:hypothetical protein
MRRLLCKLLGHRWVPYPPYHDEGEPMEICERCGCV